MHRILLVEDSPTQAQELSFLLTDAGFEVDTAPDARQAFERLTAGNFELVLTDLFLPGESGIDLCRRIKSDPLRRRIPVILITRSANPVNLLRGLEAGADDYMTKEKTPAEIAARLLRSLAPPGTPAATGGSPGRIKFRGEEFELAVERDRLLNVLLSAFEDLLQLDQRNQEELARRAWAEEALQATHHELEMRVKERTAELARANEGLRREIAEHRRTADALKRLRHQNELILHAAGEGIYGVDLEGRVTFVNPAAARMLGWMPDVLVGQSAHELLGHARSNGGMWPIAECPACRTLREGTVHRADGEMFARADGTLFPVEYISTPLRERGRLVGAVVLFHDITERQQAEEALRLHDRALEAFPQGVVIADAARQGYPIIYASQGFERLTGYARAEALGRNTRFLQGPATDPEAVARLRESLREEKPCLVELLNYRKDGRPFWNALSIAPVRDDLGRTTHFVGVQTDVTEFKRLEEQLRRVQKMEAFGQLAGSVAHDFNNFLTIINGYSELVLQGMPLDMPNRNLVEEIHKAGERSAALTRQLLAFGRKQQLEAKVLDLNALGREAGNLLRRLIGEQIELRTALAPDLGLVKVDPGQIEQVLMNLSVNARDAMPQGGLLVMETANTDLKEASTETGTPVPPGRYVTLTVSDTGIGMDEATRARIFEPFFTTKEPGKGTGLGLASVHGIVRQSGGHIEVRSALGQGATFRIYLPRVEAAAPARLPDPTRAAMPRGTETLLVAEDESAVRQFATLALGSCGYKVLQAEDGAEALRLSEQHAAPIQLLLTDVAMPNMGGRELAERLRAARPGLKVLFLSGYTDEAIMGPGAQPAGTYFLPKPFMAQTLAAKVRAILDEPEA